MLSHSSLAEAAVLPATVPTRASSGLGASFAFASLVGAFSETVASGGAVGFGSAGGSCSTGGSGSTVVRRHRPAEFAVPALMAHRSAATDRRIDKIATAGPQATIWADAFGNSTTATGQAAFARLQRDNYKNAHTTRIAAAGGGSLGSHPARDPV